MKSACPDLDPVRHALNVVQKALEAGRRIEALAKDGSDDNAIIVAAGTQRELRPALDAVRVSMEVILAARQDGYRQGERDATARAERRLAAGLGRPALQLAGG